jgi:predicted AAA+ superfamily ATPase
MFMEQTTLPLGVALQKVSAAAQREYVQSVYNTVIEKDIIARNKIRNVRAFENLIKYVFAHIGSELSPNNIAVALNADGQKVDNKTVENYISYLVSAFLLYRADRFDIKGKKQLATKEKYYLVDLGFRNVCLGKMKLQDRGHILENIVYLELLRRGYQVWVGKSNDKEVDFVAKAGDGSISYYQIAWTLEDTSTFQRELAALESIRNYYPKYVITHDMGEFIHNGIRQLNIVDWLLEC